VLGTLAVLAADPGVLSAEHPVGELRLNSTGGELLSGESARVFAEIMPLDQPIEWSVWVPESYDPERPAGALVYVSPSDSGRIPREWRPVMERRNLIWIGANASGNGIAASLRVGYAILAPTGLESGFRVDAERLYVAGFSGGGRVSSRAAREYPHLFKGAVHICGVSLWRGEKPPLLEEMRNNRYVFLSGSKDSNLRETQRAFSAYEKLGLPHIELMVIPGMGHRNPGGPDLDRAIEFLDSPAGR